MPRLEKEQIPLGVRGIKELHKSFAGLGIVKPDPREFVERFKTPNGEDVFVVFLPDKNNMLSTNQATYPRSANQLLGGVFNLPFSTSERQPEEEGA